MGGGMAGGHGCVFFFNIKKSNGIKPKHMPLFVYLILQFFEVIIF